ncbi:hypothetical protein ACLOJK_000646 [Asimina triloba]
MRIVHSPPPHFDFQTLTTSSHFFASATSSHRRRSISLRRPPVCSFFGTVHLVAHTVPISPIGSSRAVSPPPFHLAATPSPSRRDVQSSAPSPALSISSPHCPHLLNWQQQSIPTAVVPSRHDAVPISPRRPAVCSFSGTVHLVATLSPSPQSAAAEQPRPTSRPCLAVAISSPSRRLHLADPSALPIPAFSHDGGGERQGRKADNVDKGRMPEGEGKRRLGAASALVKLSSSLASGSGPQNPQSCTTENRAISTRSRLYSNVTGGSSSNAPIRLCQQVTGDLHQCPSPAVASSEHLHLRRSSPVRHSSVRHRHTTDDTDDLHQASDTINWYQSSSCLARIDPQRQQHHHCRNVTDLRRHQQRHAAASSPSPSAPPDRSNDRHCPETPSPSVPSQRPSASAIYVYPPDPTSSSSPRSARPASSSKSTSSSASNPSASKASTTLAVVRARRLHPEFPSSSSSAGHPDHRCTGPNLASVSHRCPPLARNPPASSSGSSPSRPRPPFSVCARLGSPFSPCRRSHRRRRSAITPAQAIPQLQPPRGDAPPARRNLKQHSTVVLRLRQSCDRNGEEKTLTGADRSFDVHRQRGRRPERNALSPLIGADPAKERSPEHTVADNKEEDGAPDGVLQRYTTFGAPSAVGPTSVSQSMILAVGLHISQSVDDISSGSYISQSVDDIGSGPYISQSVDDISSGPHISQSVDDISSDPHISNGPHISQSVDDISSGPHVSQLVDDITSGPYIN